MVNELGFTQISTVLRELTEQATGRKILTPANYNQFVAVAQMALKSGNEQLLDAISSVLGRTIFSVRPYRRKFGGLRASNQRFGDQTRKLSMTDQPQYDNKSYDLKEGESVDQYVIRKEKVLQMNWYGWYPYMREMMIWRNQLNVAFTGPNELARFLGMKLQNVYDQIEQDHEVCARAAVSNMIMGTLLCATENNESERVVHLITEYNAYAGTTITGADMIKPANIKTFAQWFYQRMQEILAKMEERSVLFHTCPTGYESLMRHTPRNLMKCYMFGPFMTLLDTMVHSEIFHNDYLRYMDYEKVTYWQAIKDESTLVFNPNNVPAGWADACVLGTCTYLKKDGTLATYTSPKIGGTSANKDKYAPSPIMGIIFDREACGYTVFDEHENRTPWNAKGDYAKIFFHFTDRYWNDFTENSVVLMWD